MPKFQRRHYVAVAEVIASMRLDARESEDLIATVAADTLVERSIKMFREDNTRFQEGVFRRACRP